MLAPNNKTRGDTMANEITLRKADGTWVLRAGGAVIVREWPRAAWEVRREGSRLALK